MSNRNKLYMGTNTKMFKTPSEARTHISLLRELTADIPAEELELFVIPSYTSLHLAVPAAAGRIRIGAQNMGWEERGQFTGEISPLMLRELGVNFVMVGHSERRHILHETDFEEEQKVRCALDHNFTALLCVGETARQKEYALTMETISAQLKIGLHSITPEQALEHLWVAYEPVWAIGTSGIPATAEYAEQVHTGIRQILISVLGQDAGNQIPVLYGGSVNPQNAPELIAMEHIDGLFIGRSAWDAEQFHSIIRDVLPLFRLKKGLL